MHVFFQTPYSNLNHTEGWETVNRTGHSFTRKSLPVRVRNHGFGKNADAIKNALFLPGTVLN